MTQNDLYELVADHGAVYGKALRRDSYLARSVDWPENWLEISHAIGEARADALWKGTATPFPAEVRALIRWQVETALDQEHPELVATIWLCQPAADDDVMAVEGWGTSLAVELTFKLIGHYPDETSAIKDLRKNYIFSADDLSERSMPLA